MFSVFIRNFLTFDFLIFLLAGLNFFLFVRSARRARAFARLLKPVGYLPGGLQDKARLDRHYSKYLTSEGEQDLLDSYAKLLSNYTLYENFTAIFPLMGLLGTVLSLIPMASSGVEAQSALFLAALTSTFWGLVFAIVFKALNGQLQADIELATGLLDIYVERNDHRLTGSDQDHA